METITIIKKRIRRTVPPDRKFNGKELDEETGLLYYGARYFDPKRVFWYSTDALQEKHPSTSSYCYTFGNPIGFSDPTGHDGRASIVGNTITINVNIHLYGPKATEKIASMMQSDIYSFWGKNPQTGESWMYYDNVKQKQYTVSFVVNVDLYDKSNPQKEPGLFSGRYNPFNRDNYIKVDECDISEVVGGDEGTWRSQGRAGMSIEEDDSSVHEFGHLLGFKDRYGKDNKPLKGWKGNIMAEPSMRGNVEQRNIDALVKPIIEKYNSRNINPNKEYIIDINEVGKY